MSLVSFAMQSRRQAFYNWEKKHPGTIDVLVSDLEHLKCQDDAKRILDKVKPTCAVFAAGVFT